MVLSSISRRMTGASYGKNISLKCVTLPEIFGSLSKVIVTADGCTINSRFISKIN
jgi:hypothetical protein